MKNCRNCRKTFTAKNASFCSEKCYNFYNDALKRVGIIQDETLEQSNESVLKTNQVICEHEYSKNGSVSCRKCGHTTLLRH